MHDTFKTFETCMVNKAGFNYPQFNNYSPHHHWPLETLVGGWVEIYVGCCPNFTHLFVLYLSWLVSHLNVNFTFVAFNCLFKLYVFSLMFFIYLIFN